MTPWWYDRLSEWWYNYNDHPAMYTLWTVVVVVVTGFVCFMDTYDREQKESQFEQGFQP